MKLTVKQLKTLKGLLSLCLLKYLLRTIMNCLPQKKCFQFLFTEGEGKAGSSDGLNVSNRVSWVPCGSLHVNWQGQFIMCYNVLFHNIASLSALRLCYLTVPEGHTICGCNQANWLQLCGKHMRLFKQWELQRWWRDQTDMSEAGATAPAREPEAIEGPREQLHSSHISSFLQLQPG